MKRRIVSLFLAVVTAAACVLSAKAAAVTTVQVNSVIQLGDNILVSPNVISESDLMSKYEESKEQIASNYTDIDANQKQIFGDLIPPSVNDSDLKGGSKKKSLTYEEFMDLLGKVDGLPNKSDVIEQYEEALKNKQEDMREGNKLTAEELKDFYDKVQKGIDPYTGEPFDEEDNFIDENEAARNAAQENMQLTGIGDDGSSGGNGDSEGLPAGDQFQQNLDDMSDFVKDQYKDFLTDKNFEFIEHRKLDFSEFEDDELVYEENNDDYTDIHYRCAKCGQLYGYDKMCDCDRPKYLDGSIIEKNRRAFLGSAQDALYGFRKFDKDGVAEDNLPLHKIGCSVCGKPVTLKSLDFNADDKDKFYRSEDNSIFCYECHCRAVESNGYWSDPIVDDDIQDHQEIPLYHQTYYDYYISPCTPLFPNDSDIETDDDMFGYFLSMVPEENRAEFEKLRDIFKNGSTQDMQKAFLDTIQSEEDWIMAMSMMLAYENDGPKAAFNTFMANLPDDRKDEFKDIQAKFDAGDDAAAFSAFLGLIKSEEEWNSAVHLFDKYQNEGMDAAFECFLENVPEENRSKYREAYNKFKRSIQTPQGQSTPQAAQQKKQENDKVIDQYAEMYYPDINKPLDEWTARDYEKMYKRLLEDFNKSVPPAKEQKGQKIKNTNMMDADENKIFAEWSSDQSQWTQEQWNQYNEFCEKYGHDETYLDMVEKGVFDADKSPDEVSEAIDKYIAGFTSVRDNVTLVTTVEYTDIQDLGQGGSYDVKGNARATVTDESGRIVAEREAVGGMPMTWVAYETGRYVVKRYVDVYHIEWSFQKCTAVMNAAVVLPDGESLELISGREVTRILENRDGFKQTNCQTLGADSFVVKVVEDSSNINKAEFYDTERVK